MFNFWKPQPPKRHDHDQLDRIENLLLSLAGEAGIIDARELRMERFMRQSSTDIINAVTDMANTINNVVAPGIDALKAAQDSGDDDALEAAVSNLVNAKGTLLSHLNGVSTTAAAAVTAPADPDPKAATPVVTAPPADASAPATAPSDGSTPSG